tara:strand:+ start:402 stop:569 length:168 start_codon:yes stop_codon:yes gene_type:complete
MKERRPKIRCTMSIDPVLVEKIDNLVNNKVFASRSHAAERGMHELIKLINKGELE